MEISYQTSIRVANLGLNHYTLLIDGIACGRYKTMGEAMNAARKAKEENT